MESCEFSQQERQGCGTKRFRIIQIHPTLRCNLKCLHCYSSSGPRAKQELDVELLKPAISALANQGYNAVSISGGEPFMYQGLEALFQFTKSLGIYNMATTNAMLLKSARSRRILALTDLLAISVDGRPEWHNHLRQSPVAFDKMIEGVGVANDYVPLTGFIHTVTPKSLKDLFWLGELAVAHKAKLLQLHPLEMIGRGSNLEAIQLHQQELLKIYAASFFLEQKHSGKLFIQLDLLHKKVLQLKPEIVLPNDLRSISNPTLSDVLKNIVIDHKGKISPFAYGFDDSYKVGYVTKGMNYHEIFRDYVRAKGQRMESLCQLVYKEMMHSSAQDVFNWYELIRRRSNELHALA